MPIARNPLFECLAIDAVTIADEMSRRRPPAAGLGQLTSDPFSLRMRRRSQPSVAKYMARRRRPPSEWLRRNVLQPWDGVASTDLFVVPRERIDLAHLSDQLANLKGDSWSPEVMSRLPPPKQARAGAMPADNGLGLHDCQGVRNARRKSIEGGKDQPIDIAESEPLQGPSSQHTELVTQRQVLRLKRGS